MSIRVGVILRHEDESGVSGTGVVAEWVEYSDGEVVVHWTSHTPSTNHYRNFKQVEAIHGHGGKTELVTVWEQPKPHQEEVDPEVADAAAEDAGRAQPKANLQEVGGELSEEKEPSKKALVRKRTATKKKKDDD